MTYQQTLDYMYAQLPMYHRIGAAAYKADIQPTIDLMEALGNPHRQFPSIHVAGTNGKGSVSHFMASILQQAGFKVGLYTSPHLIDFRERIRINGEMIPQQAVIDFVQQHQSTISQLHLSFFEMTVGLAFLYFAQQQVDIAVIEVGMGGRLDSTNVIQPLLSVITNIGLDHTQFLGDTLEKIAVEKAGIIKPNTPVVIGETQPESQPVFIRIARQQNAPITFADQHWRVQPAPQQPDPNQLLLQISSLNLHDPNQKTDPSWENNWSSQLTGSYQLKNIATVLEAIRNLPFPISRTHQQQGLAHVVDNTHLQGRWQTIDTCPLTICETAHNLHGIDAMLSKLTTLPFHHLHIIYGCVSDKDYAQILSHLNAQIRTLNKPYTWYFTQPTVQRQLPVAQLQQTATTLGLNGQAHATIAEAINSARTNAHPDDLILITGSIFLIADALQTLPSPPNNSHHPHHPYYPPLALSSPLSPISPH